MNETDEQGAGVGQHRRRRARSDRARRVRTLRNAAPAGLLLVLGGAALVGAALGLDQEGTGAVVGGATLAPPAANAAPVLSEPRPDPGPFTGTWSGSLDDPDTEATDARLAVSGPGRAMVVDLTDLGCRYQGPHPQDGPDGTATGTLRLDGAPRDACAETARVTLTAVDDGVRYDVRETCDDGECVPRRAGGVLTRG